MFPVAVEVLKQAVEKPFTNLFPVKYKPKVSITTVVKLLGEGKLEINPPVPLPEGFRGKIHYDIDTCIGCQLCLKVCPSKAIEFVPEKKKVRVYVSRCTFCSNCNDICPKDCFTMSDEWLLAGYDKYGPDLVVGVPLDEKGK